MNGAWNRADGVWNRVNGVWNLIFGVPDPKFGVDDLKTASKWRVSGVFRACFQSSHRNISRVLEINFDPLGWVTTVKRGRWRCASPDPPDLIGVDDFVHGDDSQSKALGLANEHAIEGIAMMLGEFLQEAAIVDVWR